MSATKLYWRSMGFWKWICLFPVVMALLLFAAAGPMVARTEKNQGEQQLGEQTFTLYTTGAVEPGAQLQLRLEPVVTDASFFLKGAQDAPQMSANGIALFEVTESCEALVAVVEFQGASAEWLLGRSISADC